KYADGSFIDPNNPLVIQRNEGSLSARQANTETLALSTPRGSHYEVILGDGTKVWLNSNTQIRYPSVFANDKRILEVLSGEVYLEVAHNEKVPFHVAVNGQDIEVLGTEFNVNANSIEKTITTLVNGSVKVKKKNGKDHIILVPGEQSV